MSFSLTRLSLEVLPAVLFPQPPIIRFGPERDMCFCGERLVVQKTRRHRTTEEVRGELAARNVRLCASGINYLGRKFITYLAVGHQQAMPRIRQAMMLAGGYILHLDATHEADAPALMTGMDSLSQIVLANVKLPSEHADQIVPFLRRLQNDYGTPKACVHDMGTGIQKAVAEVFPGIHDYICHFHFLRDIGKDFLEPAYSEFRKCLRSHTTSSRLSALVRELRQRLSEHSLNPTPLAKAIKTTNPPEDTGLLCLASTHSLALWCLQGKHSGDGYGFPFDRPLLEFAERLLKLDHRLSEFSPPGNGPDNQPLFKLAREISGAAKDPMLKLTVEELHWRSQVFDRLRRAMRIALPGNGNGLKDDGTPAAMSTIRQGVERFRRELDEDPKLSSDQLSRKMAKQIDKYGEKLFADPIEVVTPNGKITLYPQRTNNMLELFFRRFRRGQRRKAGNNSISRVLQTMLADTPLVINLDNPEYMESLLNSKDNLEELFAELEAVLARTTESQTGTDHILPGFRALINSPTLIEDVISLFSKVMKIAQSN